MDIHSVRQQMREHGIYETPLRVTYYARVSSESDEQLNSLGNQIGYYEELIRKNAAWTFVPGYIDEGLSGISTKRRENFNRMVEDAEAGMFDLSSPRKSPGLPGTRWIPSSIPGSFCVRASGSFSRMITSTPLRRIQSFVWPLCLPSRRMNCASCPPG